ncbi:MULTISPECIES: phosphate signaling complex protein PhoU [Pseudothermotoga]|jgi:phosphate transport system protein|uniref:Phosphate uptake regulator, PhoU n=2 Tax=Pseudothermotoga TaxID=1643951 RepID=A8F5R4_PSELT|nr:MULTISPECIES: phosphate signaling complex protein PhoU [Pseudothermotoga]ABV33498.1 phosphate uptake regulator, PhoU [Pseudothermotoga lettingae TMO]KUK20299.1 MAG: Phosphate uptake regulator, PhoU [Pseudothermotoga lettingae]MDI3495475.1 phosphate transport system protein [Pseudothermotoga sp.]MDK2883854.1 phosphate transport system protein [Pseudothermotoga sp.]GLI49588.1 phosphate transport system regulatory protein PhoU [Pseudothermotoga lettingae TMO]
MKWIVDEKMELFRKALMKMGWYTEKMFLNAIEALENKDSKLAKQVIEDDNVLDGMEIELREEAAVMMGIHTLIGSRLRFVVGSIQLANIFERIGDNARRISQITITLLREQPLNTSGILKLGKLTSNMLKESIRLLADLQPEGAFVICSKDAEVDELYQEIRSELLNSIRNKPDQIEKNMLLAEIAQRIEEIADLSTNVVETVLYIVTSEAYKCFRDEMKLFKQSEGVLFGNID